MTTEQYRKRSGFSIFLSFFKPHRGLFFLDMACALVVSMIDLAYPIISRYAMRTLRCCDIVAHVHDEIILEADPHVSLDAVCEQMGRMPPWAKGLVLRADGYECAFYKKD